MDIFYEEAQNLIDEMRSQLSALSQGPKTKDQIPCSSNEPARSPHSTPSNQSTALYRLFRCAHNIKSSSRSVGLDKLQKVATVLEKIFKKAGDEDFVMTADAISLLSESVQACQKLLSKEKIAGYDELLDRLNTILQPCRG